MQQSKTQQQQQRVRKQRRACTDKFCLAIFLASCLTTIILPFVAMRQGADVYHTLYPVDMQGNACGIDAPVSNLPYAAWPNPTVYDAKICVGSCAQTANTSNARMAVWYQSDQVLQYCLPSSLSPQENSSIATNSTSADLNAVVQQFSSVEASLKRSIGDMHRSWPIILVSVALAMVLSLIVFLIVARLMVVLLVVAVVFVLAAGALVIYGLAWAATTKASELSQGQTIALYVILAIVAAVLLVTICVLTRLRGAIKTALEVVKESVKAVLQQPMLLFLPFLLVTILILWSAAWVAILLEYMSVEYTSTTATPSSVTHFLVAQPGMGFAAGQHNANSDTMLQYHTVTSWEYAAVYHIFQYLWVAWFLSYFAYASIAFVVSNWYFQRRPQSACKGVLMLIRYHMGSIAFAAATVSVLQFTQTFLFYLRGKMGGGSQQPQPQQQQQHSRPTGNKRAALGVAAVAVCCSCSACCLCCLDGVLSTINKNGLVWMAYKGDNFLKSCRESFGLVVRNIGLVTSVSLVSSMSLGVTKLAVAAICSGVCTIILTNAPYFVARVSSPLAPAILVFVLSYVLASIILIVIQATMDTLFICFVLDGETHGQNKKMTGRDEIKRAMRAALKQDFNAQEQSKQQAHANNKPGTQLSGIRVEFQR